MTVGFFLVLRSDVQHYLHAAGLVREVRRWLHGCEIVQFSNETTPLVAGVTTVRRHPDAGRPLLEQRLAHYAACDGQWLLLDTDVSVRNDVRGIFDDPVFDVALCDRHWTHTSAGESVNLMPTMPFNTGVVFTRCQAFWKDTLATWTAYPSKAQGEWLSEQRAVYEVVRTGRYRVKILPGMTYNYPPASAEDVPIVAPLLHYKGPRKAWRSALAYRTIAGDA